MTGEDSKNTSVKQIASGIKYLLEKRLCTNRTNLDYGAGKYDDASVFLFSNGVICLSYDPYNRTKKHNDYVLERCISNGLVGSVTILNVLNVIPTREERLSVINHALGFMRRDGNMIISVYNSDNSRELKRTSKGWQNNQPISFYKEEIELNIDSITTKLDGKFLLIKFKSI